MRSALLGQNPPLGELAPIIGPLGMLLLLTGAVWWAMRGPVLFVAAVEWLYDRLHRRHAGEP